MSSITVVTIHSSNNKPQGYALQGSVRACDCRPGRYCCTLPGGGRVPALKRWLQHHACLSGTQPFPCFSCLLHLQERPPSLALTGLELHREGLSSYQGYFVGLRAESRASLASLALCSVAFLREQQLQPKQPRASSISKGTLLWGQDQLLA